MELQHIKSELVKKEKLLNENSKTYSHDLASLEKLDKEVANMTVSTKYLSHSSVAVVSFHSYLYIYHISKF